MVGGLYLFTLDSGLRPDELTGGDLITHQYAQVQGRPSNAPGYPLYAMLGWVWFRIARPLLGWTLNPVQILSSFSALWGLASVWVLYKLLDRSDVTGNRLIAALLTLFYAVTYFFWYYSVTTEQYTSAIFQTVLLVWLAFEWEREPADRTLLLMAFVCGTMAANMLTTLFVLPPLLYLIFTRRPEIFRRGKLVAATVIAGMLPLFSYVYVYIRGAQHPEWRGEGEWASTIEWFLQFISTQQGRDELAPGLSLQHLITPEYPSLIWGELSWLVLLGGLFGWLLLGRRKAIFLYGTLLVYLFFTTAYRFGNWFQVILPLYPLLVIGFGRALKALTDKLSTPSLLSFRLHPSSFAVIILLALIGWRLPTSLAELERHRHNTSADTGLNPGWAVLADAPPGAEISPDFEEWVALQYLTQIWRAEPAIKLLEPGTPAETITRRAAEADPSLIPAGAVHLQAVGASLIHLSPAPMTTLPAPAIPVSIDFGGQMQLIGYRIEGGGETVLLYWTAPAQLDLDYSISVRLWRGGQMMQTGETPLMQDHQPVWNAYPTSRWQPGEIIADAYTFALPPDLLPPGPDQLQIVVYHATAAGEFENLGVGMIDLP